MSERINPVGHVNAIGPFQTFDAYKAKVERCKAHPRRAECRHRPIEHKGKTGRVTRLAAHSREAWPNHYATINPERDTILRERNFCTAR